MTVPIPAEAVAEVRQEEAVGEVMVAVVLVNVKIKSTILSSKNVSIARDHVGLCSFGMSRSVLEA